MGMKAYGVDFGRPPSYIAGYKNGELVGLRTAAEWATALGTTNKTISSAYYKGRTMRNGMSFRKPTEEQMANREYLRHGVALRQAAKEARANNMTYGQLQTKIISAEHEIEVPPHWKKQPPKDDRPGPTKDQFTEYLRAKGFDARKVKECVMVKVPEIRRKYTEPLTELVKLAGYRGKYGWVVKWEEKTE